MKLSKRILSRRFYRVLGIGFLFALAVNIPAGLWLPGWGPVEGISFSTAVYIMALALFL